MVKFLIERPIAVIMTLVALAILGIIASFKLPVSMLPDIDIPEITVQINYKNCSAGELENTVVKPIRNQLLQLNYLKDIKSETRDGYSVIKLKFDYKTNINYAFIEANEKIDVLMNSFPRDMQRPKIIKANASDLPVFNLSLIPNKKYWEKENNLLQLSGLAESVIKRRIEQLSEVAMVDISGLESQEIGIIINDELLQNLNLKYSKLKNIIENNNISLSNLIIKSGQYQYNIKFSSVLKTKKDIENLYLKIDKNRIIQLKDIAKVVIRPQKRQGIYLFDNKEAVVISVIKQADAQMSQLRTKMNALLTEFNKDYPEIDFKISRDQTHLLKFSINNLKQSLFLGCFLAMIIVFFFMKDIKSPFLIIISLPASLIISMLFIYLFKVSINIISVSGLILSAGMMIDNSIIVIDNINQFKNKGFSIDKSCVLGTNEIIRPLISSVLTSCAVFVPLAFLSDISGALFLDQAIVIVISLSVSLLISIMVLPPLYRLFYLKNRKEKSSKFFEKIKLFSLENIYEKVLNLIFRYKKIFLFILVLLFLSGVVLFKYMKKQTMPDIKQSDTVLYVDWNKNINVEENEKRIINLISKINAPITYTNTLIGKQDFILNNEQKRNSSELLMFIKTQSVEDLKKVKDEISDFLTKHFLNIKFSFKTPKNVFEQLFNEDQTPLIAKIQSLNTNTLPSIDKVDNIIENIKHEPFADKVNKIPLQENLIISVLVNKLLLYDVDYQDVINKLKSSFNENKIGLLKSNNKFMPIIMGGENNLFYDILKNTKVKNKNDKLIPLEFLVSISKISDYKTIIADKQGKYIPVKLMANNKNVNTIQNKVRKIINNNNLKVKFSGSIFRNRKLLNEFGIILIISVLLLYFILAAQFESLIQPLIVLLEILFDFVGALIMLLIFNSSINIMSAIGIIVMSGIVINDSILKIDAINKLRYQNIPLLEAIKIGGIRRLKPIIMTSLTTILALIPLLFLSGIGNELQKPLVLSIIGGLTLGTIYSLFFIPLSYWFIYRKKQ